MLSAIKKLFKWIPLRVYIPLICVFGLNFLVYYGARALNQGRVHYDFSLPIDDVIPFWPWMVVVYVGCYATWVLCFIFLARANKDSFYKCVFAEMLGKIICFVFFIIIPTAMVRPQIEEGGIFNWMLSMVFSSDEPNNLFPSIHVFITWLLWIEIYHNDNSRNYELWISGVVAVLVAFSVVLVKQHVFVDIIGGIALAYFAYYMMEKIYPHITKRVNLP